VDIPGKVSRAGLNATRGHSHFSEIFPSDEPTGLMKEPKMNASTLIFLYGMALLCLIMMLIFVFWGDIVGERKIKPACGLFSRFKQSMMILPVISLHWMFHDNPAVKHRLFVARFDFKWLQWGSWLDLNILTPRPWDQSEFWKTRPKELAQMREQLRLQNEAIEKADAKTARKATEKAMGRIGRELAALRPKD
jgi:hypothetical protein